VLELEQVGIYDNFFELGGDSILSIQIIARANQAGLQVTPSSCLRTDRCRVGSSHVPIPVEQGPVTGSLLLTRFSTGSLSRSCAIHHWNQALLLKVRQAIVPALLERAVQQLLEHHDALRLRFIPKSGWQ